MKKEENSIVDFTDIIENNPSFRAYSGANGIKKGILYHGKPYMLKITHRNKDSRYTNSILSEYICSKIFSILGFSVQEVILGKIMDNGKEKLCVACKDFKEKGEYLYEFLSIKNSLLKDESSNGSGTELSEILSTIKEQKFINKNEVTKFFWDMFIVDSYLGNFDRHNGNWGFLVNENTKSTRIAPVYDCGSCLYPAATDDDLILFLNSKEEMNKRIYTFPTSAIRLEDKNINYFDFLSSTDNIHCIESLKRITSIISAKEIEVENFIESLPISNIRSTFYKTILKERKEKILEKALELNKNIEKSKENPWSKKIEKIHGIER